MRLKVRQVCQRAPDVHATLHPDEDERLAWHVWRRQQQEVSPPPLPIPPPAIDTDSEATDVEDEELLTAE